MCKLCPAFSSIRWASPGSWQEEAPSRLQFLHRRALLMHCNTQVLSAQFSYASYSERKLVDAERSNGNIGGHPATSFTSLQRAMAANNVTWIDILKIDVEGATLTKPTLLHSAQ